MPPESGASAARSGATPAPDPAAFVEESRPAECDAAPQDRFDLEFMVRADTMELLEMVQDLLSHAVAPGNVGEVFHRALTALAKDLLRTKFAITDSPRTAVRERASVGPSAAVRREVYLRDRGRCTKVSKDGRRCASRRHLQFDHIDGKFVGGRATADDFRLRCGPHNRLDAEELYGTAVGARDGGGSRVNLAMFPEFTRPGRDGAMKNRSAPTAVPAVVPRRRRPQGEMTERR